MLCVVREDLRRLLVRYSGVDNHIFALLPLSRSSNAVLVTELQRIDDTDDFILRTIVKQEK